MYTKHIPFAVKTIEEEIAIDDPLERLWRSICLQDERIIHMQKIMLVKSKEDTTKVIKKTSKGKNDSIEYKIQFAWEKEAKLINVQSKVVSVLSKMIKNYNEMLHTNWD